MTPVEITNELQISEHGETPDVTFEEEIIDDGIHTVSDDTDPYQDRTFKEIPLSEEGSIKKDEDSYSEEEFEVDESPNKFTNSRVQNNLDFTNTVKSSITEENKDQPEDHMSSPERTSITKKQSINSPGSADLGFIVLNQLKQGSLKASISLWSTK